MDVPMDYPVWNTMLGHYQRHITKLANVMPRWKTVLSTMQNDLLHEFIDKTICIILQQISIMCCCNWWALTLITVCLNTEWAMGIWHSWLKYFNCWWKAVKNLICCSCIFNVQLHVHLKKWTLKFKLLYLKNHSSYFNKICSICCVYTHIQSMKVWLKSILSWFKYNIFSRGLFFIGAPCRCNGLRLPIIRIAASSFPINFFQYWSLNTLLSRKLEVSIRILSFPVCGLGNWKLARLPFKLLEDLFAWTLRTSREIFWQHRCDC